MKELSINFILSQPRSGSTLLRLILSKAANVISLPETHFFVFKSNHVYLMPEKETDRKLIAEKWVEYHTVRKMEIDTNELKTQIISSGADWKSIFEITIALYSQTYFPNYANPTYIEKSPPHIFFIEDIIELYPRARFIHLIRDPRAVIASLRNMSWSTSNVFVLSRSWNKSYNMMNNYSNILNMRYEDIAASPDKSVAKLADFLNINAAIENYDGGLADHVEQNKLSQQEIKKPINTNNINKWQKMLSSADGEIQLIESICGENMMAQDYELMQLKKNNGYYSSRIAYTLQFLLLKLLNIFFKQK